MSAAAHVFDSTGAGGLPAPVSELFGREDVLEHLVTALTDDGVRLLTLTGLGGVGKTRLAVEVGWRVVTEFRDSARFVDLSDVAEAAAVPDELCRQLGVASFVGGGSVPRLVKALAERSQLLVIDNFEQVLDAAPLLSRIAARCPGIALLVTSRRPLRLLGEHVVAVPPLAVDGVEDPADSPAVQLYCNRARAIDVRFRADAATLTAIAHVCAKLDGLPLAIELAAARTPTLRPQQLLARLTIAPVAAGRPWASLGRAPVDVAPRHSGLEEAINWSVDLLNDAETVLFRRLAIFAGPFSADAAEAVCADPPGAQPLLGPGQVLDGLATLVDLHLLEPTADAQDGVQRFRLLETIATAAGRRLRDAGESTALQERHATYFLAMADSADAGLESADEALWYRRIDASIANLAAAFEWLSANGRITELARAVGALGPYWLHAGRFAVGRRWLTLVEPTIDELPPAVGTVCRGWSARLDLDGRAGVMSEQAAAEIIRELEQAYAATPPEPARRWLRAAEHLSYAHRLYGDAERAHDVSAAAVERCAAPEQAWWRAEHLVRLALLAEQRGDARSAQHFAAEARVAADAAGNRRAQARARQAETFADATLSLSEETSRLQDVLDRSDAVGDRRGAVTTLIGLASLAAMQGDTAGFGRGIAAAITESRDIGYQHGVGLAQTTLVIHWAAAGDLAAALRGHGALTARWPTIRRQLPSSYARAYEFAIAAAQQTLGPQASEAALAEGRRWSWDRGVDAALARARALASSGSDPPGPGPGPVRATAAGMIREPLSARELEVLALIALGLTNQEIAQRLVLSAKTVMHHSSHIYRKLGVRGRAEAVALAGRDGLLPAR